VSGDLRDRAKKAFAVKIGSLYEDKMLIRRFKFEIGIICQQFYVKDESAECDPDWTKEAAVRLLAKNTGILGIGTLRTDTYVPVILEITSAKPKHDDFARSRRMRTRRSPCSTSV
jgi:hypothetical protein